MPSALPTDALNSGAQALEFFGPKVDSRTACLARDDMLALWEDFERSQTETVSRLSSESGFCSKLDHALASGNAHCVFVLKLAGFSAIRARAGHVLTDEIIRKMSRLLAMRSPHAVIGRTAVDEFSLLLAGRWAVHQPHASCLLEEVRSLVHASLPASITIRLVAAGSDCEDQDGADSCLHYLRKQLALSPRFNWQFASPSS